MRLTELAGMRVGVWGLGLEGRAAVAAVSALADSVTVVDEAPVVDERAGDEQVGVPAGTRVFRGTDHLPELLRCHVVVASPGVPMTHPFLRRLTASGVRTVSGTDIWLQGNAWRTIGITGTKGKSTTASLAHHLLRHAGLRATLAGNIGQPLLTLPADGGVVVAELSSYQCAWITRSPRVAVVTNLYEEHIPWHGSLRSYWEHKLRIFSRGAQVLVCGRSTLDKIRKVAGIPTDLSVRTFDDDSAATGADGGLMEVDVDALPPALRAQHNIHNVKCALVAIAAYQGSDHPHPLGAALEDFGALPSRLEVVHAGTDGIVWVDDCLSTTPESVIAAAESFSPNHTVLIVGGQSRGVSYDGLNDYLLGSPANLEIITIPSNGPAAVERYAARFPARVHRAGDLPEAVGLARRLAAGTTYVVLSPGAPSFDYYRDYKDKSNHFRAAVADTTPPG